MVIVLRSTPAGWSSAKPIASATASGLIATGGACLFIEDGRERLLWFTPRSGTDTAEKLALLTVVGTQAMQTRQSHGTQAASASATVS